MKKMFISRNGLNCELSKAEFDEMTQLKEKGIIALKATKNDNITSLALNLTKLFSSQRFSSKKPKSQEALMLYLEANKIAGEALALLEPYIDKIDKRK